MSQRGGKRKGAGRPLGEPSKTIRVPTSRISEIQVLLEQEVPSYSLPVYASKVQAGFPSPGDDYIERYLDLNQQLITHPAATFIVRASGDSMINAGIYSGDLLVVDRSLEAQHGKIVIAAVNGELTVKRLSIQKDKIQLLPENSAYSPIAIGDEQHLLIWGVVTYVIHALAV